MPKLHTPGVLRTAGDEPRIEVSGEGTQLCVKLEGHLGAGQAALHREVLPLARRFRRSQIRIDCADVTFFDLDGLDCVLLVSSYGTPSGRVVLLDPPERVLVLLRMTKMTEVFDLQLSRGGDRTLDLNGR